MMTKSVNFFPQIINMAQAREADRLRSPFIIQDSNSVKADKTGLSEGELITHYSSDAVTLKVIRDDLQILVDKKITPRAPGTTIAITHFKNWGDTQISLLMHAKPTLSGQVAALVQAVVEYNKTRIPEVIKPRCTRVMCVCVHACAFINFV